MTRIFGNRKAQVGKFADIMRGGVIMILLAIVIPGILVAEEREKDNKKEEIEDAIVRTEALNYFLRSPLNSFSTADFTIEERNSWKLVTDNVAEPVVADLFAFWRMDLPSSDQYKTIIVKLFDGDPALEGNRVGFVREELTVEGLITTYEYAGTFQKDCKKKKEEGYLIPSTYSDEEKSFEIRIRYCTEVKN